MGAKKSLESAVEQTILQKERTFSIGGVQYTAERPTLGTLFMISSLISELPEIDDSADVSKIIGTAICAPSIAKIASILILGAKRIKTEENSRNQRLFARSKHSTSSLEELTDSILLNCTAKDVSVFIAEQLKNSDIEDFFAITTFLREANLTRPTKVVKTSATAPGR